MSEYLITVSGKIGALSGVLSCLILAFVAFTIVGNISIDSADLGNKLFWRGAIRMAAAALFFALLWVLLPG